MEVGSKSVFLSPAELFTFLFKTKLCPKCNIKLVRHDNDKLIKKGWMRNIVRLPGDFKFSYGKHYLKHIAYHCPKCSGIYYLKNLGEKR